MRFQRPSLPVTVLVLLLALVAGACGSGQSASSPGEPTPSSMVARDLSGEPVRVAVLAIRSAVAANAQYGSILEYLEQATGRPFELVPVGQEDQFTLVEQGDVDFVFTNPLAAVQIRRLHGTEFLATLSRNGTGPYFGGLIISRAGSGIESADDLPGRRVTCVAFETAAGGCNFQLMYLRQLGVGPSDFAEFTETPSQDNIVLGVLNGGADVGFIRTGQLEKMVDEGTLLSVDEVTIVDRVTDDYVFPHTTPLYPEWPFAAVRGTDPGFVDEVRTALLELGPEDPAMVNAGARGFVAGVDYDTVEDMIVELELYSWDATGA